MPATGEGLMVTGNEKLKMKNEQLIMDNAPSPWLRWSPILVENEI